MAHLQSLQESLEADRTALSRALGEATAHKAGTSTAHPTEGRNSSTEAIVVEVLETRIRELEARLGELEAVNSELTVQEATAKTSVQQLELQLQDGAAYVAQLTDYLQTTVAELEELRAASSSQERGRSGSIASSAGSTRGRGNSGASAEVSRISVEVELNKAQEKLHIFELERDQSAGL